jgi:hypothetical protein
MEQLNIRIRSTKAEHRSRKQAQGDQGAMLWYHFSAIFGNFRWKNWRFLKNQCYGQNFAQISFVLSQNRQFLGKNI